MNADRLREEAEESLADVTVIDPAAWPRRGVSGNSPQLAAVHGRLNMALARLSSRATLDTGVRRGRTLRLGSF
ncbi:MAG: hypothetical protein AAF602_24825 [Myxococcota bacterium]